MSEWYDNQKKPSSNFRKLLQERIEKVNPRHELTAEENKRVNKLETIAGKLKRGEHVQNRQLKTWLNEDEYTETEAELLESSTLYTFCK
jgi:predicted ribosome quality control (RQC) complex YloA/Tae2 family protein